MIKTGLKRGRSYEIRKKERRNREIKKERTPVHTSGLNLVKYFPDSDDQGGNTFLPNTCLNIYL